MTRRRIFDIPAVVLGAAMLVAAAAYTARIRAERYPLHQSEDEALYVTSGTAARRLTAGYNVLAADLYWIRAIQYYGGTKLRVAEAAGEPRVEGQASGVDYRLLYPLLDLTTSLDPGF